MNSQLPLWVQYSQSLMPIIIAVAALAITVVFSYRQWRTAKGKLRYDLFERRFAVYAAMMKLFYEYKTKDHPSPAAMNQMFPILDEAKFLFGREVHKFLSEIVDGLFERIKLEHQMSRVQYKNADEIGPKSDELIVKIERLWSRRDELFAPYLKIDTRI
jgi:hypothetical protein